MWQSDFSGQEERSANASESSTEEKKKCDREKREEDGG